MGGETQLGQWERGRITMLSMQEVRTVVLLISLREQVSQCVAVVNSLGSVVVVHGTQVLVS
jgi:hypothetical protein